MFCENCGNKLLNGAKFCDGCGAKIKPALQVNANPVPTQPAPGPTQSSVAYSTQQRYTPPPVSYTTPNYTNATPLSVGQYIVMFLLLSVPLLNLVLLFMWGFGGSVNPNKRNFARASLIFAAVGLVLAIIGGGVIMGVLSEIMSGFN